MKNNSLNSFKPYRFWQTWKLLSKIAVLKQVFIVQSTQKVNLLTRTAAPCNLIFCIIRTYELPWNNFTGHGDVFRLYCCESERLIKSVETNKVVQLSVNLVWVINLSIWKKRLLNFISNNRGNASVKA